MPVSEAALSVLSQPRTQKQHKLNQLHVQCDSMCATHCIGHMPDDMAADEHCGICLLNVLTLICNQQPLTMSARPNELCVHITRLFWCKLRNNSHQAAVDSIAMLLEDVNATVGAAEIMIRLLELCPPLPIARPLKDGPNQTTEANGAGQDCPAAASTQAQAVHQPALWPTPKPADGQKMELVAVKACMSLDWALSLTSLPCIPAKAVHEMTALLCHLLQCLVAGHLPDLKMDMQKLFKAGLHPVLTAQVAGHAACSDLAAAMLSRMAVDTSMMLPGSSVAGKLLCIL